MPNVNTYSGSLITTKIVKIKYIETQSIHLSIYNLTHLLQILEQTARRRQDLGRDLRGVVRPLGRQLQQRAQTERANLAVMEAKEAVNVAEPLLQEVQEHTTASVLGSRGLVERYKTHTTVKTHVL